MNLKKVLFLFVFLIIGLLLLLPSFDYLISIKDKTFSSDSIDSYLSDMKYNYQAAIPLNTLRMAGNAGSPMQILGYNNNSWWVFLGFAVPSLILFYLFTNRKISNEYLIAFLLVIVITISFLYLTKLGLNDWLFKNIQYLFSLRNPKYIMYAYSLSIAIFFGLGVESITNRCKNTMKLFVIILITASVIIYLYPIWEGSMGLSTRHGGYLVPDYYSSTFNYLEANAKEENFRVLWLPYTYTIQTRLVTNVNHVGVRLGQHIHNSPSYDIVQNVFLDIASDNSKNLAKNLGLLNVKYLVVDKSYTIEQQYSETNPYIPNYVELYYQYLTPFIRGPPEAFVKYFNQAKDFKKIYEDKNIVIYQNSFFRPYFYSINIPEIAQNETNDYNLLANGDFTNGTTHWRIWNLEFGGNVSTVNGSIKSVKITNPSNIHTITINQEFRAIPKIEYTLSFKLKYENTNHSGIKIFWYGKESNLIEKNALLEQNISLISGYRDNWTEFEEKFLPPEGAVLGVVTIVAGPSQNGSKYSVSSFSDITLTNNYYLSNEAKLNNFKIEPIESYKKNIGQFIVELPKNRRQILVLSESFDDDWKAYSNNHELVHYKIFEWANAYIIPFEENGAIEITYSPQRTRNYVILIWLLIWVLVIVTLIILIISKFMRRK